ncbi:MAG: MotA/TolQ/ExbB proton channel family protein [Myxococcales bacterium]|nr:MotA/TolQ/ExbB proton channel family protein [Myxococcales bacterium]
MAADKATLSLAELLAQGGFTMIPIYACSLVALALFLHKVFGLRRQRHREMGWFEPVLERVREGDYEAASGECARAPHPGARVVRAMMDVLRDRPDRAESEARRVGSFELQQAERGLGVLSFIAQAAPLLGLLGTVFGMVDLFIGLQGAGGANVAVSALSGGIWKALLTTAAGLSVAVPTLAGHSYLASRADKLKLQLTDVIGQVMTAAPALPTPADATSTSSES